MHVSKNVRKKAYQSACDVFERNLVDSEKKSRQTTFMTRYVSFFLLSLAFLEFLYEAQTCFIQRALEEYMYACIMHAFFFQTCAHSYTWNGCAQACMHKCHRVSVSVPHHTVCFWHNTYKKHRRRRWKPNGNSELCVGVWTMGSCMGVSKICEAVWVVFV